MKRYFVFIALTVFALSCNDEHDPGRMCAVTNPAEDLDWLASDIEVWKRSQLAEYAYVSAVEYEGTTVFIYGNCCPYCNSIFQVYNCSGEVIGSMGDGNFDTSLLEHAEVIWKGENSSCFFN